jgi:hypothetical protein
VFGGAMIVVVAGKGAAVWAGGRAGGTAGAGVAEAQFTVMVPEPVEPLLFAVIDAWPPLLFGAVYTASTPPPSVVAVLGLSEPIFVVKETLVPSGTKPPVRLRTVIVTKAVPLQLTLVGEAATETWDAPATVGVPSPVPQTSEFKEVAATCDAAVSWNPAEPEEVHVNSTWSCLAPPPRLFQVSDWVLWPMKTSPVFGDSCGMPKVPKPFAARLIWVLGAPV